MKVAVVGSREYTDYESFSRKLNEWRKNNRMDMIISGGAKGVDEMAYRYAVQHGITFVCHPPIPEEGYPQMFFRRNLRIVEMCEFLIAFPKGKSTGTRHSIGLAKKLGKHGLVVEVT